LDIQLSLEVKTFIYKETFHNHLTLTKSAKISPIIKAIKNLLDENMTFVDYDDESVTE
jgi:hypothetical protein